jgi:hypothetical protein
LLEEYSWKNFTTILHATARLFQQFDIYFGSRGAYRMVVMYKIHLEILEKFLKY